jgi:hypothetical protein
MGFGQAISHNLSNITNFSGRAGRSPAASGELTSPS